MQTLLPSHLRGHRSRPRPFQGLLASSISARPLGTVTSFAQDFHRLVARAYPVSHLTITFSVGIEAMFVVPPMYHQSTAVQYESPP